MNGYEVVIGLEIHVQLRTRTKLFCADAVTFGAAPNTAVCPLCLGLPGALPVTNAAAVDLAVRAALALDCTIHETSRFSRKSYFYPDLPKGYQITQLEQPLASGGALPITTFRGDRQRVAIRRLHLEEDAGRSLHDRFAGLTAIDLNRAGVPLIEIVTEPVLRAPADARRFLDRLRQTLRYVGVSDCDMEKGSLRVDANVSLRAAGDRGLGAKTEVKNMNSFASVERALDFEIARQAGILSAGGQVRTETRLWDADRGEARSMRSKEGRHDYRYFPEPDLPPLILEPQWIERVRSELPELPAAREARFRSAYGLPAYDAAVLTADHRVADYFEAVAGLSGEAKTAGHWVMRDVLAWLNQHGSGPAGIPVPAPELARLIRLVRDGTISQTAARRAFQLMATSGLGADAVIAAHGLAQVTDERTLRDWAAAVIREHPAEAERYRRGEARVLGFLMGQVMKRSAGTADPQRAAAILRTLLEA